MTFNQDRRRLLFVSGYYPPHAPSGAVRMPKLVKYWMARGHEVKVIAVRNPDLGNALASEHEGAEVAHVGFNPPTLPIIERLKRQTPAPRSGTQAALPTQQASPAASSQGTGLVGSLKRYYHQILLTPDRYRSWVEPAVAQGMSMARSWRPDVIYSSAPPQSSHIVAARLSQSLGCPWYAELRDLWIGNPYVDLAPPIRWLNDRLAAHTLRQAAGFVAVTTHARDELVERFGKPTLVAYNGFDPEDFAGLDTAQPLDPDKLTIVHAGVIYAGRRDPSALFEAIARLGDRGGQVVVHFYHDEHGYVQTLADRFGVAGSVRMHGLVPRREILRVERAADVMLLCRWNNPADDGVIPGKLFEYIGARRPVLAVGSETGEAADIVRQGGFGLVSNDPAVIADQLDRWLVDKAHAGGRLPDFDAAAADRFDRRWQFDAIERLLFAPVAAQAASNDQTYGRRPHRAI